jgi:uncharacterized protein (DUF4415 family)
VISARAEAWVSLRLDADVIAWLKKDGKGIRRGRIGC